MTYVRVWFSIQIATLIWLTLHSLNISEHPAQPVHINLTISQHKTQGHNKLQLQFIQKILSNYKVFQGQMIDLCKEQSQEWSSSPALIFKSQAHSQIECGTAGLIKFNLIN